MKRVAWSIIVLALVSDLEAGFPTTTTVNCSPNPAAIGQEMTCGANVSGPPRTSVPANGRVTFYDGAMVIYSMTLLEGGAGFTTSSLAQGTHPISAVYDGNASFDGSTSNTVYEVIGQAGPPSTSTTLGSSQNPAAPGDAVIFTMMVTSSGGTPAGAVTLMDGSVVVARPALINGMAAVTVSFTSTGSHPMKAVYGGNASFGPSSATLSQQVVQPAPVRFATVLAATSSINPSVASQVVTFNATVLADGGGAPTGMIEWFDGAQLLQTTPLDAAGQTTLAVALTAGSHIVAAYYAGDALHFDSSSTIVQTVSPVAPRRRAAHH